MMRTTTEVKGLSPRQADYIRTNVKVDGRDFLPGLPKMCTTFELAEGEELHVEMDVVEFAGLMAVLGSMELRAKAEFLLGVEPA